MVQYYRRASRHLRPFPAGGGEAAEATVRPRGQDGPRQVGSPHQDRVLSAGPRSSPELRVVPAEPKIRR